MRSPGREGPASYARVHDEIMMEHGAVRAAGAGSPWQLLPMTRAPRMTLLCILCLLAPPALAGHDGFGVIRGVVWSQESYGALGGVEVILRSPLLYKGERNVFTDENGFYWFPQLPPGPYQIVFVFEGYNPHFREEVVRLNQVHMLNVGMWSRDHVCSCLSHPRTGMYTLLPWGL